MPKALSIPHKNSATTLDGMYKALKAYASRVGCTKPSGLMPVGWDVQSSQGLCQ